MFFVKSGFVLIGLPRTPNRTRVERTWTRVQAMDS